jgi:xylulose-5-phosphate/fructose-6-phosphate phosphoketolase
MQTIKWLEVVDRHLAWRRSLPSVNILLTSTCWRNDHNGFSHQGPGFIDTLLTKQGNVVRTLFPCDANTLLVTMKECFETTDKVNCICIDKQPHLQFLTFDEATQHHKAGISEWKWASHLKEGQQPDIVLACCGDVMTQESLAAAAFLREHAPDFTFRFVNVLDLMRMYAPQHHPRGMPQEEFEQLFGREEDVVFAYHSYPSSLHQLLHNRAKPERFHVRGYTENGTTTTPFQMVREETHRRHRRACSMGGRFSQATLRHSRPCVRLSPSLLCLLFPPPLCLCSLFFSLSLLFCRCV